MQTPLLRKLPEFPQILHGIEQHKLAVILGSIVVVGLIYILNIPVERQSSAGLELTNDQGIAVGYLGFEYLQTPSIARSDDMAFLKHTAIVLKAGLSGPLEPLNHLE